MKTSSGGEVNICTSVANPTEDFRALYAAMPDEEILHLAADGGLRPEAEAAFNEQLRLRKIFPEAVRVERKRRTEAELKIKVGWNRFYRGTGLQFYGRKFLNNRDEDKGTIVVTRWIVFVHMPLIPIGSYRVREWKSNLQASRIVGRVDLQWDQVRAEWFRALLVFLLILLGGFVLFVFFSYWDGKPLWRR